MRNGLGDPKQGAGLQWHGSEESGKDKDLQNQLARLIELGFVREKQNLRLLRKLGSVEEVIQVLTERREKREKRGRREDEGGRPHYGILPTILILTKPNHRISHPNLTSNSLQKAQDQL